MAENEGGDPILATDDPARAARRARRRRRDIMWGSIPAAILSLGAGADVALFLFGTGLRNPLQDIPTAVRFVILIAVSPGIAWLFVKLRASLVAFDHRLDAMEDEMEEHRRVMEVLRRHPETRRWFFRDDTDDTD